jgi:hypothetical protein
MNIEIHIDLEVIWFCVSVSEKRNSHHEETWMRGYHLLPNMDWVMEGRYVFSFSEFMFLPLLIVSALLYIYYDKQRHFSMLSLFWECVHVKW